jgi:hypothetical protein
VLLLLPWSCEGAAAPPHASIELSALEHDFGPIFVDEEVEYSFEIHNRGLEELHVYDVHSSCGCAVLSLSNDRLAPDQSAQLRVLVTARQSEGQLDKSIQLRCNDPQRSEVRLRFRAFVEPLYLLEPEVLDLGEVLRGTQASASVEVRVREGALPRVLEVPDLESLAVECPEGGAGDSFSARITLTAPDRVGPFLQHASLRTDHPRQPWVRIPVRAAILGEVYLQPNEVNFGEIVRSKGAECEVFLRVHELARSQQVEAVHLVTNLDREGRSDLLRSEIETVEEGRLYRLRLRLLPDAPGAALFGRMEVQVAGEAQPLRSVAVKGVFRD